MTYSTSPGFSPAVVGAGASATTSVLSTMKLFDQLFGTQVRELMAEEHALKLAAGEFKLNASLKGHSFVTTRNRTDRLAHIADRSYTVWRRTLAGPALQRLVARAICGQWVMQAQHADWFRDEPRCQRCLSALASLLKEADEREVEAA